MARVELRHSTIRLRDGFSATAAVNDTPANGDTLLLIDTFVDAGEAALTAPPVSSRFTIVGADETYEVTEVDTNERQTVTVDATSGNFTLTYAGQTTANIDEGATAAAVQSALEALSNIAVGDVLVTGSAGGPWTVEFRGTLAGTNVAEMTATDVDLMGGGDTVAVATAHQGGTVYSITFTPALATAAGIPANDAVITFGGRSLEIKVGDGNLTWTEAREMNYDLDRGELDTVREGDQQPMEVSLDFVWETMKALSGGTPTFHEVLHHSGEASDWVTSSTDPCEPYSIDIEVDIEKPCGGEHELYLFPDFRFESIEPDLGEAQVSVSGRCNVLFPTITRIS